MNSKLHVRRILVSFIIVSSFLFMTGCAHQALDLSNIKQGKVNPSSNNISHFQESAYSVYMLFDLIDVSPANVDDIIKKANPGNKPVANLKVTSEADVLTALVNILNGGIIDRGVIVSLNKVTVEGDLCEPIPPAAPAAASAVPAAQAPAASTPAAPAPAATNTNQPQ